MALYKKRPVEVRAEKLTIDSMLCVAAWINSSVPDVAEATIDLAGSPQISIKTLEGTMLASDGDFIIQGVKGEFYPCKPDIFNETYVRVA